MTQWKVTVRRFIGFVAAIVAGLALSSLAVQAQVAFSAPQNISNDSGGSENPQIAVDSHGNIDVVWNDTTPGIAAVFFSRSSDGGVTFTTPVNLSNDTTSEAINEGIAVDASGNIYVSWMQGGEVVYFTSSTDGGVTFAIPKAISSGTTASGGFLAVDSTGAIDIVWGDSSLGYPAVLFARSTDQGATFSAPLNLSGSGTVAAAPAAIAVDSNQGIYVGWSATYPYTGLPEGMTALYFASSTGAGGTFSTPVQISGNSPYLISHTTIAAASSTNIAIGWTTAGDETTSSFAYSNNGGASFTVLGGQTAEDSIVTSGVAVDSGDGDDVLSQGCQEDCYVVFQRFVAGQSIVSTFPQLYGSSAAIPVLAVGSDGAINVLLSGSTTSPFSGSTTSSPGLSGVLFLRSIDEGATFSAPQIISSTVGQTPQITTDAGGNVYVVWTQYPSNTATAPDVYFSRGTLTLTSTVTVNPTSVTGDGTSSGTVTLRGPAPAGGAVISLSSSNAAVASVPASVTVPSGSTTQTFNVATTPVSISTQVSISASWGGSTQSATLTVLPPALTSVSLNTNSVTGGTSETGTVNVSASAPTGGLTVSLLSGNTGVAQVPASVAIPAGATSATFAITTTTVTTATSVTISASLNGTSYNVSLTVSPTPITSSGTTPTKTTLSASPNPAVAGQSLTLTATISPAPTGVSTGTVNFYDGTTLLGTGTANASGIATFPTNSLSAGVQSVTAVYSGNSGFDGSTSTALSLTVGTTPTCTLSAPQTPVTATEGAAVNVTITVGSVGGVFDNPVALSASGLPTGATATFNPSSVTPGSAGASSLMTVQLPNSSEGIPFKWPSRGPIAPTILLLAMGLALWGQRQSKALRPALAAALLVCMTVTFAACAGSTGSSNSATPSTDAPSQNAPAHSYVVTVTGTSGSQQASTTVTLQVQ